jgi:dephospho-CoA kinase
MLILCGPSCAGKTTFGSFAAKRGIKVVEGSNAVRALFKEQRLEDEDVINFCLRWYSENGKDVFARANIDILRSKGIDPDRVVFVGCRTLEEVEYLSKCSIHATVISLHADTSIRFQRSIERDRPQKALTLADFVKQDMRELDMGLAHILSRANRFIANEASFADLEAIASHELMSHFDGFSGLAEI